MQDRESRSPAYPREQELLGRVVDAAARQVAEAGAGPDGAFPADEVALRDFLLAYYRHAPAEDLRDRQPADLAGAALSHRETAAVRQSGDVHVEVFTPLVDVHGWTSGHTVVQVVSDDMPFLVDSLVAELSRQGRGLHLVVHPQLLVKRDGDGALDSIAPYLPGSTPGPGELVESWISLEVDRDTDPERLAVLRERVLAVLGDVHAAVRDWPAMREQALLLAVELTQRPPARVPAPEVREAQRLLLWLAEDNFTFLGYREYRLESDGGGDVLVPEPGSGLGILHEEPGRRPARPRPLGEHVRDLVRAPHLLVLTKANSRSTVHRPAYLDYVGIKTFDADGNVRGERRFLGLYTDAAYAGSIRRIPVLQATVAEVMDRAGLTADSHSGRDLLHVLETYPRDELFQLDAASLYPIAMGILHLKERRRTRLFVRRDGYGRFVSCLVFLPRDRYTTAVRLAVQEVLREAFGGHAVDYTARVSESVLARLHVVVWVDPAAPVAHLRAEDLEERLVEITRSWEEDLSEACVAALGEQAAPGVLRAWDRAFPEAYKEDFAARVAVGDLRRLEALDGDPLGLSTSLYQRVGAGPSERRFKLYSWSRLVLTTVLPYLSHLGVEVLDERPYELARSDGRIAYVYDFGLRWNGSDDVRDRFSEAFLAAWSGRADSDGFQRLVLLAALDWRQVAVVRAYARYLRQTGTTFSQQYVEQCLATHPELTAALVELFAVRFDPDRFVGSGTSGPDASEREAAAEALAARITEGLDAVASLDHDRILRSLLALVLATTRTNAYTAAFRDAAVPALALKLDPTRIPDLPQPRPAHEVFVSSPRVEGVHLRFGAVARGGLRWSDRPEDFRTEILGLVKAQVVKNAVIVPTGAKGGFVCRRLPDSGDREAWLAEGTACYRTFVGALLDVTDGLAPAADGRREVLPPPRVVRHDGDDPYLVVAADKGTATFSDLANEVALARGFWLGDAFASGGSVGYDHKAMGITARGAWESVRRHFRELGSDVARDDITVVGVGDMSGDVFGNGMLLSEHLRLVAAFDHRHVFLDPDPDPQASFAQRRRLFALSRSSWADYDPDALSPGGGVYPRTAKSVPVSAQVAARLGIARDVRSLPPNALIQAILTAPVDLLWNGGIGTYVKASAQTHAEVGDKGNDAVRVDASQLRARVVGEGGNLGLTQLARVEAAALGVRLNTDAIDNSAGVDCSDHEVNIKILLDQVVADGDLTGKQRAALLAEMTGDVAAGVLADNEAQNLLLGVARSRSATMLAVHRRFLRALEARGLDRALEFLPSDDALAARGEQGLGLTSPELAVLVAYAKITLADDLAAGGFPDDPVLDADLRRYFPPALVSGYGDRLAGHPLRREIVLTCLANEIINTGGITMAFRAQEETGADAEQVARAYVAARDVFALPAFLSALAAEEALPADAHTALVLEARRLLDRAVRWFVRTSSGPVDVAAAVARFRPVAAALGPKLPELLVGAEAQAQLREVERLRAAGAPAGLAEAGAGLLVQFLVLDITRIAEATGEGPEIAARVWLELSARLGVDDLLTRITSLPRPDRWSAMARAALRYDVYDVLGSLTAAVLRCADDPDPQVRLDVWTAGAAPMLAHADATLDQVRSLERADLASLSVALRTLRGIAA